MRLRKGDMVRIVIGALSGWRGVVELVRDRPGSSTQDVVILMTNGQRVTMPEYGVVGYTTISKQARDAAYRFPLHWTELIPWQTTGGNASR